jgi:hypothetical protein
VFRVAVLAVVLLGIGVAVTAVIWSQARRLRQDIRRVEAAHNLRGIGRAARIYQQQNPPPAKPGAGGPTDPIGR